MPDIDPHSVESINSIKHRYEDLRSKSKTPTFALTYDGTWRTLMKNCGFTEEEAKMVEASFNKLYIVSIMWVAERLKEASRIGYITAAFGLRVRTPVLKQVVMGTCTTPREAEAEGRSAGNALGQSWCLLNNRAANEFAEINMHNKRMRESIRPCAHIHDAQYFLVRNNSQVVHYLNTHLVKCVQWQEDPLIQHPTVKLGGELSIFYPTWKDEIELPNYATEEEIINICKQSMEKD